MNWTTPEYTCFNGQVSAGNNLKVLESVQGTHEVGKTNADVKGLHVIYNVRTTQLEKLPSGIDKFFPNLEGLGWIDGNLTSITSDDLSFPQLKFLFLFRNQIVSLDSKLFQHTPRLSSIDFWDNQIAHVGLDLLANLNELDAVSFSDNVCIDSFAYTPQQIQELKQKLVDQCPPLESIAALTKASFGILFLVGFLTFN